MLKVSLEELSALNLILQFTSVEELLQVAQVGFAEKANLTQRDQEKADLYWKILKTLRK